MKKNKTIFSLVLFSIVMLVFVLGTTAMATTYYTNVNGSPSTLNNWWTGTSGTGSHPANFTTAGDIFVIQSGDNMTTTTSWTVSGTGSSIQVDGTLSVSFSPPSTNHVITVSGNVSGNGTLSGGTNARLYNVGGDWTFNGTSSSPLTLTLNGTSDQTLSGVITTNATCNLTVNKSSGKVILGSAVSVLGTLTLTSGNIVTDNTNLLTLGSSAIVSGGGKSSFVKGPLAWITSSNLKTFPVGKKDTVYRPVQFTSLTGTNTSTKLQVEVFENGTGGTPGSGLDALSYVRYFKISKPAGTISNFAVKLVYRTDDQVSVFGDLRVAAQTGADSVANLYGALGTNAGNKIGNGEITSNNAAWNGTNPIFLTLANVEGGGNALPVELASFSAAVNNNVVVLSWVTKTEKNNYGFSVERSVKNEEWIKVGFVNGYGNSNSPKNYSFSDKASNGTFSYRLKQINTDGSYVYSESIAVEVNAKPMKYNIANYPNPFNPETKIQFELPQASHVNLTIYNIVGEKVATLVNENMEAGVYQRTFSSNSLNGQLSSGIYLYRLATDNGINITKKMVLAK